MSVWALIQSGGWIMVPLFLCSVVVWVVFIERFLAFRGWKEKNEQFLLSFSNHWLKGDREGAKALTERSTVEVADLARYMASSGASDPFVLNRIDRRRQEQAADLKKYLWILGTVGSAAPFIGLFGTVIGIIESFQSMAETGAGGFNVVAAGISQALVATAGGIIVAVIAVFLYNYFQVRVGQMQFQLRLFGEQLVELYKENQNGHAP
jgi:biopolymer transport protein ExbB